MASTLHHLVTNTFYDKFGFQPAIGVSAPGRVNLIGEHTDYSDGFVMPVAIDRGITIALHPREDQRLRVFSIDFEEMMDVSINALEHSHAGWQEYIKGVAWVLREEGHSLSGWDGVFAGNVPIGAGLSSSAALEVAAAKTFSHISQFEKTATQLALIGQKAEGDWVGVKVGIMDQLISTLGKQGHAVLIDCQTLAYQYVPIPKEISLMVLDTGTRRELTNSVYNIRRAECEEAARILGVPVLRSATASMLAEQKPTMAENIYKRARHVISENKRVHAFGRAMRNGSMEEMGRLINQCHHSLKEDFEVSSDELNIIVEISQQHPACLGARMTGAGFGGCALAIISSSEEEMFSNDVSEVYRAQTGLLPDIFQVQSADGVHLILDDR